MYSTLLYHRGVCIVVENYLYRIKLYPVKTFVSMQDCVNEINKIENNFREIWNRIANGDRCDQKPNENSSLNENI